MEDDLWCPIIIDVEASGFGAGSYPIEIGVVLNNGSSYCSLVLPEPTWTHWDEQAQKVHGITREILYAHGKQVKQVAQELNHLLNGKQVYTDGWGVDRSWIALLYEYAGIPQRFQLETIRKILTEEQVPLWHPTQNAVTEELQLPRHRASTDALILQRTYQRTLGNTDEK